MEKKRLHDKVLERAMQWAKKNKPESSDEHKASFANSVACLMTGWSGGYGGPSVREHAVSWAMGLQGQGFIDQDMGITIIHQDPKFSESGQWDFEKAVKFAEPVVFGPITDLHRRCWAKEHCFDDDPDDVRELPAK